MKKQPRKAKDFKVAFSIPAETIQGVIDSVAGGPYSGWIKTMAVDVHVQSGRNVVVFDKADDPEGSFKGRMCINRPEIEAGLSAMAKKNPGQLANILTNEYDAITADVFMQCVVFGEEIYG